MAEPGAEPTAECTEDKSADNTVDRDRAEKNRPTDYEEQQTQQVRRSARLIEKRKTAKDVTSVSVIRHLDENIFKVKSKSVKKSKSQSVK